jgi:hypothetical protein
VPLSSAARGKAVCVEAMRFSASSGPSGHVLERVILEFVAQPALGRQLVSHAGMGCHR